MSQLPIPFIVEPKDDDGKHKLYRFANGYGVSTGDGRGNYADKGRTVEAAIIRYDDSPRGWSFAHDALDVNHHDVRGWVTMEELRVLCEAVSKI